METLKYLQKTGELWGPGYLLGVGYSGAGDHKNNPDAQCHKDLGPIPRGKYKIGKLDDYPLGDGGILKQALPLTPDPNNDMCERRGFYIHGESAKHPGWASEGCIIIGLEIRKKIGISGVTDLEVL